MVCKPGLREGKAEKFLLIDLSVWTMHSTKTSECFIAALTLSIFDIHDIFVKFHSCAFSHQHWWYKIVDLYISYLWKQLRVYIWVNHVIHMVAMLQEFLIIIMCFATSYQICEFLYEKNHQYDMIIDCYLKDPLRKVRQIIQFFWLKSVNLHMYYTVM